MIDTRPIRMRWEADGSKRDERGQRLFAASEARAAGWGGVAAVAKITGVSRKRIIAGLKDLAAPPLDPGRVRRKGGGRRPITETDGTIGEDLKRLVEPVTMGDPMRPLMWVSKSQEKLADELVALGHDVSPNTVGRLLVDELAYSRQVNRKTHEGSSHPDRNAQFEHINAQVKAAQAAGNLGSNVAQAHPQMPRPSKPSPGQCRNSAPELLLTSTTSPAPIHVSASRTTRCCS